MKRPMHTPAPWTVETDGLPDGTYHLASWNPADTYTKRGIDGIDEENEANRRLIEKAPDLLAIVKEFVTGAIIRGRCVWCSYPDEPADGTHTSTCLVLRAQHLMLAVTADKEGKE